MQLKRINRADGIQWVTGDIKYYCKRKKFISGSVKYPKCGATKTNF